jgi:hypothetical protein
MSTCGGWRRSTLVGLLSERRSPRRGPVGVFSHRVRDGVVEDAGG